MGLFFSTELVTVGYGTPQKDATVKFDQIEVKWEKAFEESVYDALKTQLTRF